MTWEGWQAARALLAEEFVWQPRRAAEAEQRAIDDEKHRRAMASVRRP